MSRVIKGIPAASGVGMGKVMIVSQEMEEFKISRKIISRDKFAEEIVKLEEALSKTRDELVDIRKQIAREMGISHAQIFDAHLLVLEDRNLIEDVIKKIKHKRLNAEAAFYEALRKYVDIFSKIEDEYLRERVHDIKDVGKRVLKNLLKEKGADLIDESKIKEKCILVAHDLAPSQTVSLRKDKVEAFVTDIGGRTSHTAILARSMGTPAVVGTEVATSEIQPNDFLIVDGTSGKVIVNPTDEEKDFYRKEKQKRARALKRYLYTKRLVPETKDGRVVTIASNIEFPEEMSFVLEFGAQGVGLYRTEYFYINRVRLPSEEEQYRAYREVARKVYPYSAIVRTLDLGGDKFMSQVDVPEDIQSFLGWRAIRFCLARPDIFRVQLRAILRAAVEGNLMVMYPMVSGVNEVIQANAILEECKEELRKEKKPFNENIKVGAMIEVPSAALISDILSDYVNFFSIGTNDLIQYALAVDRTNEKVAYLYKPAHPAVLRLVKSIIDAGHKNGIWVGMCGEMSSEPVFIYLLLGMGIDELSMPPFLIPRAKILIRSVNYEDAKKVASQVINMKDSFEVERFCIKHLKETLGDTYSKIFEG